MTGYTIPDDLRPWVEATAPTLGARDWSGLRWWQQHHNLATPEMLGERVCGMSPEQRDALLAYRDEVAAGLSYRPRVMLARVVAGHQPESNDGYHECVRLAERRMLAVVDGQWFARDWGREIARVLGGADSQELLCTCIDDVDTDPDCVAHGARVLGGAR